MKKYLISLLFLALISPTAGYSVAHAVRDCFVQLSIAESKAPTSDQPEKIAYSILSQKNVCEPIGHFIYGHEYEEDFPIQIAMYDAKNLLLGRYSYVSSRILIIDSKEPIPEAPGGIVELENGTLDVVLPTFANASYITLTDTQGTYRLPMQQSILQGKGVVPRVSVSAPLVNTSWYSGEPLSVAWTLAGQKDERWFKSQKGVALVSLSLWRNGTLVKNLVTQTDALSAKVNFLNGDVPTGRGYSIRVTADGQLDVYGQSGGITILPKRNVPAVVVPVIPPIVCLSGYTCTPVGAPLPPCPPGYTCTTVMRGCPPGYTCTTATQTVQPSTTLVAPDTTRTPSVPDSTTTSPIIIPVASVTFSVTPTTINAGDKARFSWSTANVTKCSSNWNSSTMVDVSATIANTFGSEDIYVPASKTYFLTCFDAAGKVIAKSVYVSVKIIEPTTSVVAPSTTRTLSVPDSTTTSPIIIPVASVTFSVTPTTINAGDKARFSWSTANVTKCSSNWNSATIVDTSATTANVSGTEDISVSASKTFWLTCFDAAGKVIAKSVYVKINTPTSTNLILNSFKDYTRQMANGWIAVAHFFFGWTE